MYIISNKDVSIIILIMRVTCTAATKASLIDKKIDECHHFLAKSKGMMILNNESMRNKKQTEIQKNRRNP